MAFWGACRGSFCCSHWSSWLFLLWKKDSYNLLFNSERKPSVCMHHPFECAAHRGPVQFYDIITCLLMALRSWPRVNTLWLPWSPGLYWHRWWSFHRRASCWMSALSCPSQIWVCTQAHNVNTMGHWAHNVQQCIRPSSLIPSRLDVLIGFCSVARDFFCEMIRKAFNVEIQINTEKEKSLGWFISAQPQET